MTQRASAPEPTVVSPSATSPTVVVPPTPPASELVGGRYDLLDLVGTGAMGAVFVALDTRTDRVVALKRLHTRDPGDEVARARFRLEAECLASLDHPGLPRIFDFGEEVDGPAVHPYLVMQLVTGDPLDELLAELGRLEQRPAAGVVAGLAEALAVVHADGIVHRDLKPGNVVVRDDGRPVLLDFGIASPEGGEPLTATGEILGTLDYISPEQVSGRRATAASDIYSLGVVAHTCLTGERPFRRETPLASAMAHVNDPVPALPDGIDPGLREVVRAMLAKEPDDRPTAGEVARLVRDVAG